MAVMKVPSINFGAFDAMPRKRGQQSIKRLVVEAKQHANYVERVRSFHVAEGKKAKVYDRRLVR